MTVPPAEVLDLIPVRWGQRIPLMASLPGLNGMLAKIEPQTCRYSGMTACGNSLGFGLEHACAWNGLQDYCSGVFGRLIGLKPLPRRFGRPALAKADLRKVASRPLLAQ